MDVEFGLWSLTLSDAPLGAPTAIVLANIIAKLILAY